MCLYAKVNFVHGRCNRYFHILFKINIFLNYTVFLPWLVNKIINFKNWIMCCKIWEWYCALVTFFPSICLYLNVNNSHVLSLQHDTLTIFLNSLVIAVLIIKHDICPLRTKSSDHNLCTVQSVKLRHQFTLHNFTSNKSAGNEPFFIHSIAGQ